MAARTGMTGLIAQLRRLTDAEEDAVTVAGETYWTDDHLQDILDNYAQDIVDVPLRSNPTYEEGSWEYRRYYIPKMIPRTLETPTEDSDNTFFVVSDTGTVIPTSSYTYDSRLRRLLFNSDQLGHVYYLRAVSYNVNEAAAEVWRTKASFRVALVEWKGGDHSIKEDQEWQHCMQMAEFFEGKYGIKSVQMRKMDYGIPDRQN
jgi:hypothetical protein